LNADYTPLENNMNWAISSTKGCYTGQEVIARQITYDKVTRKLVGVRLGAEVAVGSTVFAGKQAAGTVTSTALSSKFGPIALAMIKRPHNETGADVTIGDQDSGVLGTVADLPFS
jgi:folate-binding protein YgfZ